MSELRRLWPRFKLSTILVLVAITVWTMSMRPFLEFAEHKLGTNDGRSALVLYTSEDPFSIQYPLLRLGPMPHLYGPLLTLTAFLVWRLRKAIRTRRQREQLALAPLFF